MILETMLEEIIKYKTTNNASPAYCYLSIEEGFDLLKEIKDSIPLTHLQRAEVNIVLSEKNVTGLVQAFSDCTIEGVKVRIIKELH